MSFQAVSLAKKDDPAAENLFHLAAQKYQEAIDLNQKNYQAYFLWGIISLFFEFSRIGIFFWIFLKLAWIIIFLNFTLFLHTVEFSRNFPFFWSFLLCFEDCFKLFSLGNLLLEEASSRQNATEIHEKLVASCKKFEQSYLIFPNNFQLLYNWGFALLYRTKIDPLNERILSQVYIQLSLYYIIIILFYFILFYFYIYFLFFILFFYIFYFIFL